MLLANMFTIYQNITRNPKLFMIIKLTQIASGDETNVITVCHLGVIWFELNHKITYICIIHKQII